LSNGSWHYLNANKWSKGFHANNRYRKARPLAVERHLGEVRPSSSRDSGRHSADKLELIFVMGHGEA
jgi:hypothetical protein